MNKNRILSLTIYTLSGSLSMIQILFIAAVLSSTPELNLVEQLMAKRYNYSEDTNASPNSSVLKSAPESQVKQRWARLTHGWVTAREYRVPLNFSSNFLCITKRLSYYLKISELVL